MNIHLIRYTKQPTNDRHPNATDTGFKTNILSQQQERNVRALLDKAAGILKWNFDHYDCDHVLRVVTDSLYPEYIQEIIRQAGFDCTELPD